MDSNALKEIKNEIAILPLLRERVNKLRTRIRNSEREINSLLEKYKEECLDVEQLKEGSFSAFLLKVVGKYERRLEKEEQEIITAKLEYDKACQELQDLKEELSEKEKRIIVLRDKERTYEEEIKKREQMLINRMNTELSEKYFELEQEYDFLQKQLIETDEAIRAAKMAKGTAKSAMGHLGSAESWATYDVWAKGGILSHMAKYDHVDKAEADFNRLSSQLKILKKELLDVNINDAPGLTNIDSTTRTIDFWFDNIFTDLNVRDKIRGNIDQIRSVSGNIDRIIRKLENRKREINSKLSDIDYEKNKLILSL
ncbi:MAG TPA: hypothetical protein VFD00_03395 [Thermoclostridium sp.]|nr:hypothetical protein [Thermoclostridium sp.]